MALQSRTDPPAPGDVPPDVARDLYEDSRTVVRWELWFAVPAGLIGLAILGLGVALLREGERVPPNLWIGAMPLLASVAALRRWHRLRHATPQEMLATDARERAAADAEARTRSRESLVTPWVTFGIAAGLLVVALAQYGTGSLAASVGAVGFDRAAGGWAEPWRLLTTGLLFPRPAPMAYFRPLDPIVLTVACWLLVGSTIERRGRQRDVPLVFLVGQVAAAAGQAIVSDRVLIGPFGGVFAVLGFGLVAVWPRWTGTVTPKSAGEALLAVGFALLFAVGSGPAHVGYVFGALAGLWFGVVSPEPIAGAAVASPLPGDTGEHREQTGRIHGRLATPAPAGRWVSAVRWPSDADEDAQVASTPATLDWPRRVWVPSVILGAAGFWTVVRLVGIWPK
ncbi:MAG: rhomboid family intramembrane serine protease [Vicinamibacterales bacterium]